MDAAFYAPHCRSALLTAAAGKFSGRPVRCVTKNATYLSAPAVTRDRHRWRYPTRLNWCSLQISKLKYVALSMRVGWKRYMETYTLAVQSSVDENRHGSTPPFEETGSSVLQHSHLTSINAQHLPENSPRSHTTCMQRLVIFV